MGFKPPKPEEKLVASSDKEVELEMSGEGNMVLEEDSNGEKESKFTTTITTAATDLSPVSFFFV